MDSTKGEDAASEVETFLPNSGSNMTASAKYKISIVSGRRDSEVIQLDGVNGKPYDPFKERVNPNPTTDCETFTHLLKASLGSGILSMPYAFKCAGITTGLLATIVTAIVCTYGSYILVKCAHTLYYRVRINKMSYAEVAEVAFANGPKALRKWSRVAKLCVMFSLFVTYFGAISCYTVIAGKSFQEVIQYYTQYEMNVRIYILSVLPPLVALGFIPNLKALAPFSTVANILIASSLGITLYYMVMLTKMHSVSELRQVPEAFGDLPSTFSITVFAMEAIGLMMPLENNMKNPTHFLGVCGVLNRGMSIVSMVYILIGFIGYLAYGDRVEQNITENLPVGEIAPQFAKVFIGISVLLTYVLQFFVCLEIGWNAIKDRFVKETKIYNSLFRTLLVFSSVCLALAVPQIAPLVSLIGALCFSFLGILFPVIIEIITYWETHSVLKLVLRNLLVIVFGVMALCFGTYTSMLDIIKIYVSDQGVNNSSVESTTLNSISQ